MEYNASNDSFLGMFIFEASQLIEQLEQMILTSEGVQFFDQAAINEIFRIMHTIKGSAAMMSLQNISKLAHSLEDIFYYLREEKPEEINYADLSDLVLEGIDFIKAEVEQLAKDKISDGDESEFIQRQKKFLTCLKNGDMKPATDSPATSYKAIIYFEDGCEMENIRAFGIVHNLNKLVNEVSHIPENLIDDNDSVNIIRTDGFVIYFKSELSYEILQQFFEQTIFLKDMELLLWNENETSEEQDSSTVQARENTHEIRTSDAAKNSKEAPEVERTSQSAVTQQSFISVSVSKLDKLLDLVGEMVISEAMVINNPDLQELELINFHKAAHRLNKISNEIKDMVMSIRMVPLSATFHKMHRVVRDMNKKLNKKVRLQVIGEETEVDKNIIEHITDPLMHLIRNAVDHGIETSQDRELSGKSKEGVITLEAKNAGRDVLIIVRDDGCGLDKERILKKAKESNLLHAEAELMSDQEIFNLILHPGFSTKDSITEYSGRGVGMDVVARNIEAVSGSLSIDSVPGKGTSVTIKIPLTLAIIDAMNIMVGNSYYSIPTIFIRESFSLKESNLITDPEGNEMIMIRGQCYPVKRLYKLFDITTNITNDADGIFIMIQQEEKCTILFADKLIGQQQIVVKSLPRYIKNLSKAKGISGCTLLGDGSISLILDTAVLVNHRN